MRCQEEHPSLRAWCGGDYAGLWDPHDPSTDRESTWFYKIDPEAECSSQGPDGSGCTFMGTEHFLS